jgi:hypothetical protein
MGKRFFERYWQRKAFKQVEHGKNYETLALILRHDGRAEILGRDARYPKVTFGQEAVIEAAGLE